MTEYKGEVKVERIVIIYKSAHYQVGVVDDLWGAVV